eukprot:TRINITY_DN4729_c0_g4_i1.p1 TRINITY_DN4729_c0_g4~~TRINITY_DN4729_c0_g4_i1.p1  ORF type:complete len:880 (-),score=224.19 TRINITY_DN4729_c0_g4_i1:111-2750(-)
MVFARMRRSLGGESSDGSSDAAVSCEKAELPACGPPAGAGAGRDRRSLGSVASRRSSVASRRSVQTLEIDHMSEDDMGWSIPIWHFDPTDPRSQSYDAEPLCEDASEEFSGSTDVREHFAPSDQRSQCEDAEVLCENDCGELSRSGADFAEPFDPADSRLQGADADVRCEGDCGQSSCSADLRTRSEEARPPSSRGSPSSRSLPAQQPQQPCAAAAAANFSPALTPAQSPAQPPALQQLASALSQLTPLEQRLSVSSVTSEASSPVRGVSAGDSSHAEASGQQPRRRQKPMAPSDEEGSGFFPNRSSDMEMEMERLESGFFPNRSSDMEEEMERELESQAALDSGFFPNRGSDREAELERELESQAALDPGFLPDRCSDAEAELKRELESQAASESGFLPDRSSDMEAEMKRELESQAASESGSCRSRSGDIEAEMAHEVESHTSNDSGYVPYRNCDAKVEMTGKIELQARRFMEPVCLGDGGFHTDGMPRSIDYPISQAERHTRVLCTLGNERDAAEADIHALRDQNAELRDENDRFNDYAADLVDLLRQRDTYLDKDGLDERGEPVAELEAELARVRLFHFGDEKDSRAESQGSGDEQNQEVRQERQEFQQDRRSESSDRFLQLENEVERLRERNASLEKECRSEPTDRILALENEVERLRERNASLEKSRERVRELEADVERLRERDDSLDKVASSCSSSAPASAASAADGQLEAEIAKLREENAFLQNLYSNVKARFPAVITSEVVAKGAYSKAGSASRQQAVTDAEREECRKAGGYYEACLSEALDNHVRASDTVAILKSAIAGAEAEERRTEDILNEVRKKGWKEPAPEVTDTNRLPALCMSPSGASASAGFLSCRSSALTDNTPFSPAARSS